MTNEEAIKILTELKPIPVDGFKIIAKAYDLAIEALEKQIPKKPDMWGDGYSEGEIVMESYECPKCGCIYDFDTDGKLNFCHNCGQAIDWEVSE